MSTYGTIPDSSDTSAVGITKAEFLTRAIKRIKTNLGVKRPWKEMFSIHSLNLPHGFPDTISRTKTNVAYFRMNYAIIVLGVLFLSLIWHPISLIVFIVLMAVWLFLYLLRDEPLVILHYTIDDRVILTVLSVVTTCLLLLTGTTLNILVSVMIGVAVVLIHAIFRKNDDLCLDEDGAEADGFLPASA
ncbi:PRA1 family protein F3-like [Rutidosis leptorrhynchoides]|uniref:PRA1 family protein F3-like n=1 Tax=Rutidosis leptorrhynchoides TaxID=125765 RepID=UPI003A98EDF0